MAQTGTTASKRKRDGEDHCRDLSDGEDESNEAKNKLWRCPFSVEREGATAICKWRPHKDKRSLHNHLRDIRMVDMVGQEQKSEIGGDSYHLFDDPLWNTEEIQHLVHGKPKTSKEEQRMKKKEYHKEYYRKAKEEKERLAAAFNAGEITKDEYEEGVAKYSLGWYKIILEAKKFAKDLTYFRTRVRSIFAQSPSNHNPLPLQWPTSASSDAYQKLVCLCTPVHHLVQISDPTTRNVQITLKTALSPDKDYLNKWLPLEKRKSLAAIFNSSCDIMNATINSMSKEEKHRFDQEWAQRRDQFIFSLAGDSRNVGPFVLLDLIAFAWKDKKYEINGKVIGNDEDDRNAIEAVEKVNIWEQGLAGKLDEM